MDGENHHWGLEIIPIFVGFLGVMTGALMVAIFHCIMEVCHRMPSTQTSTISTNQMQSIPRNIQETVQLVVTSKYSEECKAEVCAVCLTEFKEGDEVRVLSECSHIFHILCINQWLQNHHSCPLCRADTVSAPLPPRF
ncbi:RING-H2 finger protein ATL52 [Forsythia ovata]|uniref:RING-H2 finger protein ATL52 n=1 Tax=Forsythia ovata TaxID=205694 RepID=A0ABD1T9V1_9LAMI